MIVITAVLQYSIPVVITAVRQYSTPVVKYSTPGASFGVGHGFRTHGSTYFDLGVLTRVFAHSWVSAIEHYFKSRSVTTYTASLLARHGMVRARGTPPQMRMGWRLAMHASPDTPHGLSPLPSALLFTLSLLLWRLPLGFSRIRGLGDFPLFQVIRGLGVFIFVIIFVN